MRPRSTARGATRENLRRRTQQTAALLVGERTAPPVMTAAHFGARGLRPAFALRALPVSRSLRFLVSCCGCAVALAALAAPSQATVVHAVAELPPGSGHAVQIGDVSRDGRRLLAVTSDPGSVWSVGARDGTALQAGRSGIAPPRDFDRRPGADADETPVSYIPRERRIQDLSERPGVCGLLG